MVLEMKQLYSSPARNYLLVSELHFEPQYPQQPGHSAADWCCLPETFDRSNYFLLSQAAEICELVHAGVQSVLQLVSHGLPSHFAPMPL